MKHEKSRHEEIHLGTHGEDYGSWMSNPVFYMIGGLLALSVVLAVLSFTGFRLPRLGAGFSVAAAAFLALLCWGGWVRKQYAFGGGGVVGRWDKDGFCVQYIRLEGGGVFYRHIRRDRELRGLLDDE